MKQSKTADQSLNTQLLRTEGFIDGQWIFGRKTFPVVNPYNEELIAEVADLGKHEALQAVEAAYRAFPAWSHVLASERSKKLIVLSQLIEQNSKDLAFLITLEQGKPLEESLQEVQGTIETIRWYAAEANRIHGLTQSDPDISRIAMTIRQPIGVVAVIPPWNFPLQIPTQKCFAALAAGCTVVVKPAEDTPLSVLALASLCEQAEFPKGVINVVTCLSPEEVGKVLMTHPLVSKVTFTGSTEVGKKILETSASTVKKVTLELGGNCPFIAFDDADLDKAVDGALALKSYNAGQCCTAANRIFVHSSIYDVFIDKYAQKAKKLASGSGFESKHIGPLINQAAKKKLETLVQDAVQKGAKLVMAPEFQGLVCSPAIIKNADRKMNVWHQEIFGPVAVFYRFDAEEEAVAMANDTSYGLAAYFYTENLGRTFRIAKALQAGSVGINTCYVYSITLPFGGWKESGIGRESGIERPLDDFCEVKSISIGK